MILYESLEDARIDRDRRKEPVATIGFFDGLHEGHRHLLDELRHWARDVDGEAIVVTFDPHPRKVLTGSGPARVLCPRHRLLLLERGGIDVALALQFDRALSEWSPEQFVDRVLVGALGCRRLLLGFDSAIGNDRLGTFEYLSERVGVLGIELRQGSRYVKNGQRVSSTLLREAIEDGDLEGFKHWTGRNYSAVGKVVAGDGRGRGLGFPTANLEPGCELTLPDGVYFALADRLDSELLNATRDGAPLDSKPALVNIGSRPTFASSREDEREGPHIEVHLLDFEGDLYGAHLEVHFLHRHRAERRFSSADELARQIREDERAFRAFVSQGVSS